MVGGAVELRAPYEELTIRSPFKGNLPMIITPLKDYGSGNEKLDTEFKRAEVFNRIVAMARGHSQHGKLMTCSLFPSAARANEAYATGKVRLVPFTDTASKVVAGKKLGPTAEIEFEDCDILSNLLPDLTLRLKRNGQRAYYCATFSGSVLHPTVMKPT